MIQPIPARGMRPSTIEIKSITERIALLKKTVVCAQFRVLSKAGNMVQWLPAQATTAIRLQGRGGAAPCKKDWRDQGLNVASTVLLSLAASVTFCVCSPNFSCTNAIVESPGGKPFISN